MPATLTLVELQTIQTEANKIKSRRGQILKSLELLLNTIDPSIRSNYSTKVRDVSFDVNDWASVVESKTPTIFLVDGIVDIRRFPTVTREYKWAVTLFGVCKKMSFFEFEEHIADVQECIENNYTLAQSVSKSEITRVITDNQLFSEKTKTHLYSMEIELNYLQKFGDPKSSTC